MNPAVLITSCADVPGAREIPGESRFYVSLEDDLMRLFGASTIEGVMDRLGMDDSMPIENKMVSRGIENAQKKVESRNFSIRKNVLNTMMLLTSKEEVIYGERKKVLDGENLKDTISSMIDDVIDDSSRQLCRRDLNILMIGICQV
jgi:preprotein translocase subunit SecA